ncbi:hypothetical protein BsWGS_19971 [Bradybaena similaris]
MTVLLMYTHTQQSHGRIHKVRSDANDTQSSRQRNGAAGGCRTCTQTSGPPGAACVRSNRTTMSHQRTHHNVPPAYTPQCPTSVHTTMSHQRTHHNVPPAYTPQCPTSVHTCHTEHPTTDKKCLFIDTKCLAGHTHTI